MAKRKPIKVADPEILALVDWLNEMSIRVFMVDQNAARRYARMSQLLCDLDQLKRR